MVKTLQKSSSPEPAGRFSWNLVCKHRGLQPIIVCSNDDPGSDPDLFYGKVKFGYLGFSIGKVKTVDFSEHLQPATWNQLKKMNICEYWEGQGHFLTLPKVIYIQNLKLAFLRNHWANQSQILYVSFQVQGNENLLTWCWSHDQDGCHAHIW